MGLPIMIMDENAARQRQDRRANVKIDAGTASGCGRSDPADPTGR